MSLVDDGGMTSLSALLWCADNSAKVEFGPSNCCVSIPQSNTIGYGRGSPGQAFIIAVMSVREQLACVNK